MRHAIMGRRRKQELRPRSDPDAPLPGDELKGWRTRLGWLQEEAAANLGVPLGTYRNWEQDRPGRGVPYPRTLRMLMKQINKARKIPTD